MKSFSLRGVICRDLAKDYISGDSRVRALRGVDLEVAPGELTLLVGPSGCGKTTLISILAATLDATAGEVHVPGAERRLRLPAVQPAPLPYRCRECGRAARHQRLLAACGPGPRRSRAHDHG